MANIQEKMAKKKGTGGVVAQMVQGNNVSDTKPETSTVAAPEIKETKIEAQEVKKPKQALEGVIAYKQVPDENKSVRKNIVLYPSLSKEIERIVNLEQKKGNKRFTFNDLVNQVLIDYANEYNKK